MENLMYKPLCVLFDGSQYEKNGVLREHRDNLLREHPKSTPKLYLNEGVICVDHHEVLVIRDTSYEFWADKMRGMSCSEIILHESTIITPSDAKIAGACIRSA